MERVKLWLKAKVRPFEERTSFSFGVFCGTSIRDLLLLAPGGAGPGSRVHQKRRRTKGPSGIGSSWLLQWALPCSG